MKRLTVAVLVIIALVVIIVVVLALWLFDHAGGPTPHGALFILHWPRESEIRG
jgi:hypothetical protein